MPTKQISAGAFHTLPTDLKKALTSSKSGDSLDAWEDITPLARNEWICWVESAKHIDTRTRRVERVVSELAEGVRRPCCWAGCIHRPGRKPFVRNKK